MMTRSGFALAAAVVVLAGAAKETQAAVWNEAALARINKLTAEDWARVRRAYIFFGRHSVGQNILNGLKELMQEQAHYEVTLRYIYNDYRAYQKRPGLGHRGVGRNGDPDSKIEAFKELIHAGGKVTHPLGDRVHLAFFKFCFLDIVRNTDASRLFRTYRSKMEALESQHAKTVFIYTTVPIGRGGRDDVTRNRYNDLVRQYCKQANKPLFDIASVEASKGGGERCTFESGGKDYDLVCPGYCGGDPHLNSTGGRRVAKVMMVMFAELLRDRFPSL